MAKKRGAPAKLTAEVKGRHVQVRMDETEREAFGQAAHLSGLTLSAWIRTRLRDAVKKEMGSKSPF